MLMAMDLSRRYTAILENATRVSYEKMENQIGTIQFTLPLDDPKNVFLNAMLWVELIDNENEYIGLFRIQTSSIQKDKSANTVSYVAIHALSTLLDSVLFGYYEITNKKTKDVINFILAQQKVKHWVLKKCDFSYNFSYAWENENGLADALFSIPEAFNEDYSWSWNTQVYPFELSLSRVSDKKPVARIQEGYNMIGFEIEKNPNDLINRVYPLGAGEGVNQVNITSVNKGVPYIESQESIKKYGLIEYVYVDQRFSQPQALLDNVKGLLTKWAEPIISWTVSAADLLKLAGERLAIDRLRVGSIIMVNTDDFGSVNLRIKKESKRDVFGAPYDIQLELGNIKGDLSSTISNLSKKQTISETYSQGSTNLLTYSYADNCEKDFPAVIDFFIDDDVFHVNTVELTFKTKKYRGYTKAVKGGGATVKSTSAGGATTSTSTSGGGSTQSSTSGGGYSSGSTTNSGGGSTQTSSVNGQSTQTSSAGGDHGHIMLRYVSDYNGGIDQFKRRIFRSDNNNDWFVIESLNTKDIPTASSSGHHSHSVSTPAHSHSVSVPSHSHNFSISIPNHNHKMTIPNHSHKVTIPNHTHQITLPDHTHPLEWGIYESNTSASKVDIVVDGKILPSHNTSMERLNLVDYLKKSNDGKIAKGWHKIEMKPNLLARIEAQVICRVFIQSQLGGQY